MTTTTSYPVRLEKKIIDAVRPIAKRNRRTIKAQIEAMLDAAVRVEVKP